MWYVLPSARLQATLHVYLPSRRTALPRNRKAAIKHKQRERFRASLRLVTTVVQDEYSAWLVQSLDRGIPPKLVHEALECASMLQVPQVFSYSFDEAYRPAADYVQRVGEGPALSRHVSFDPQTFRPAP